MRLKNTASQPTSLHSCHLPCPPKGFLGLRKFYYNSRGWEIDLFSVFWLNLELPFRCKRLFLHPCCLYCPFTIPWP